MKVDFNSLRRQTASNLDAVIQKLNDGKLSFSIDALNNSQTTIRGNILVNAHELQSDLDALRSNVWALCCIYQEGENAFPEVSEQVEKDGGIAIFNPEPDEET